MKEKFVDYEGGRIYYTDRGAGDTIVLIHGYLETSEVWGRFADRLSERYRIIAVDLPGNGRSSLYSQNHTMCFHARAVLAAINQEKIEKFVVIGHSLGAGVSLKATTKLKGKVNAVIIVDQFRSLEIEFDSTHLANLYYTTRDNYRNFDFNYNYFWE